MPRSPSGRIGRVSNGESTYLALLVIDAAHAGNYRGIDSEHYERAMKAIDRGRSQVRVGDATAVAVEIGGCGLADVHRLGDAIVIAEHYTGENDAASEAALDHAIAATPTTKPARLGKVEVT